MMNQVESSQTPRHGGTGDSPRFSALAVTLALVFSWASPSADEESLFHPSSLDLPALGDDYRIARADAGSGMGGAQPEGDGPAGGLTQAQISEMINNPLGELWLLFTQNDTSWWNGDLTDKFDEDDKVMNSTIFMPVLPMQLTEDWKFIFRPIVPVHSFDTPDEFSIIRDEAERPIGANLDFDRKTGLGDIVLWSAFTTNEGARPPYVFGAGPTVMLDTASKDELGTGKWSAGPMAIGMYMGEKWILGAIGQHWWDFAGDGDRDDVNLTDLQYIYRYKITPETNIGAAPNIRYNWDADSGERLQLPVGLGVDTMIKIGPAPAKIGLEAYYFVEQPDAFGPEWQIRFFLVPVMPQPSWAKTPLFGD